MIGRPMNTLPKAYSDFAATFPNVESAYKSLGETVASAGPLEKKVQELVKIGISVGARQESSIRSHVRKALQAGATRDEILHAVLQATTTVGFATMMAGMSNALRILEPEAVNVD